MPDEPVPTGETSRSHSDHDAEAERRRRIDVLSAIARGQQQLEPAAIRPKTGQEKRPVRRKRSRARWLVAGAAVVCVAVIGALALRGLLASPPPHTSNAAPPPAILTLDPVVDGIGCPYDVAWSPSDTTIAVLGAAYCGGPGVVRLYNAVSGKPIATVHLDDSVRTTLTSFLTSAPGTPAIFYEHVSWSPNGQRLAVTFAVTFPDNPNTSLAITGVLVGNATGGQSHVLLERQRGFSFYTRWDLRADAGTLVPAAVALSPLVFSTLPPAVSYQWDANDTLSPATPLPNNAAGAAPAPVPVGNPDGDANFTIWQPATASLQAHTPSPDPAQHDVAAQAYTLQTDFVAWSPDGRYLIDKVQLTGRLALPGQHALSPQQLDALQLAQAPVLPVRDTALAGLLSQMKPNEADALAWLRYGEYVAVQRMMPYAPNGAPNNATDHTVTIYDCFTGQIVGILHPTAGLARLNGFSQLRWSPDGSRLLLDDGTLGTITIWGQSVLPKS